MSGRQVGRKKWKKKHIITTQSWHWLGSLSFQLGGRTTMNLGRDFLDYFMCYPSSPAPTSCSFHVIFGSKRNEKKIFFFLLASSGHTHTHLVYERRRRREWSLGAFLSSFSVGCCCCCRKKERAEREVDKSSSLLHWKRRRRSREK